MSKARQQSIDRKAVNAALFLSDGGIQEHAYLISRGVRPLALFNPFPADPPLMLHVSTRLENLSLSLRGAIPFVVDEGNGMAIAGYAANRGVVETFLWVEKTAQKPHRDRLLGLLLGYSIPAIVTYEQEQSIRQFDMSTVLPGQESSSPPCDTQNTEEMFPPY